MVPNLAVAPVGRDRGRGYISLYN